MSKSNFEKSRKAVGWVTLKDATQETYDKIGFKSGLEVHQQLATKEKLFCHCPAGKYHRFNDYDAEIVRHMRPTLSELGEYDGTALMEFKTRKNITYRIKNQTTCTYEIDDTPPFPMNREALDYATEISLLLGLNIVGEVHIIRKQYLDGSIPTGFQRTAIIGIEGEIPLKNKNIRIIQLSIEEDACREVSDIRHERIYITDRLGMPLIETVTYPEMINPDEVYEAGQYIRFLARSTGKVRVGIGAGRQDVNVSCKGGTRIEIKGVARLKWVPLLTHNECFRQWALLRMRRIIRRRVDVSDFAINHVQLMPELFDIGYEPLKERIAAGDKLLAVRLPHFKGLLSHFTQPDKPFYDELAGRLKVIACLERPNILTSEDIAPVLTPTETKIINRQLGCNPKDAFVVFWAPKADVETALEVIEERCKMLFEGVPQETRRPLPDGTTIFERVLPGADRMYPDTDSAPIAISEEKIQSLLAGLPPHVYKRLEQLQSWGIPADTYPYILRNNLMPLIEDIVQKHKYEPMFVCTTLAHTLKHIEGQINPASQFDKKIISGLFAFVRKNKLDQDIIAEMLPVVFKHPVMEFESVLNVIGYKKYTKKQILADLPALAKMFTGIRNETAGPNALHSWIMGELRQKAMGNINLRELSQIVQQEVAND